MVKRLGIHVAEVLRTTVRRGDLAGHIGGEEFVAICLDTGALGVMHLAERLRAAIENQAIKITGADHPLHCTVTIGVSHRCADAHALEDAMRQADAALYRGKAAGRNRIELAQAAHCNQPTQSMGTSTTCQTGTVV